MKKEVLIAVLIGFGLGLLITYGLYRMRAAIIGQDQATEIDQLTREEPEDEEVSSVLALHSPEDGTVQTETSTRITGTTLPDTFVVLFINEVDIIVNTDETGNFSHEAELEPGTNVITAHVVNAEGETFTTQRVVIVTDLYTQTPEPEDESAEDAEDANEE
ncbi:MAG: hypothetical protein WDZ94_03345 [Patescibacteria group bacterium]